MQSENDVIWRCCVLSNLECYMQNSTKMLNYCWFKFMLSEYNYIHFTGGLVYWTWTARRSVDNHFNDNSTQKEQQLLTVALCLVCEDAPQLRSIQLHKILPTPLTKIFPGTPCATWCLQAYSPLYSSALSINKIPQHQHVTRNSELLTVAKDVISESKNRCFLAPVSASWFN